MKLTHVLTACNENNLYMDFIPIFCETWKKIVPEINIIIVFISNTIPEELNNYKKYIYLFPPIKNIPTSFQSQCIRIIYPSLLDDAEQITQSV